MGTDYNYDEQGQFFPYFIATIVSTITIPLTYSLLAPTKDAESIAPRIESDYKPKDANIIASLRGRVKRRSRKYKRLVVVIIGWLVIAWMSYLAYSAEIEAPVIWDPYSVLGVSRLSTKTDIKRHYRKLSLVHHPDKAKVDTSTNITIDSIQAKWIEISKAYLSLTDEEARNNWQLYGNPDGKQTTSIGIALPKLIVTDGNGKYVMILYLGILGVLLPYFVGRWWYGIQKRTRDGVFASSAAHLFTQYDETHTEQDVLTTISQTDEFGPIVKPHQAQGQTESLEARILDDSNYNYSRLSAGVKQLKTSLLKMEGVNRKTLALLWAHLHRIDLDDENDNLEKYDAVPAAVRLAACQAGIAIIRSRNEPLRASYRLSQHLIQAVPFNGSPLLQLPYMTRELVRAIEQHLHHQNCQVDDFMNLSPEVRKRITVDGGFMTESELAESESLASKLLVFRVVTVFFKVNGEPVVNPQSLVQLVIKGRFVNPGASDLPEPSQEDLEYKDDPEMTINSHSTDNSTTNPVRPPLVYAPYFVQDHLPQWHAYLHDAKTGQIIVPPRTFSSFNKPILDELTQKPTYAIQTLVMQFGAPPEVGKFPFMFSMVCDSYIGSDIDQKIHLVVEPFVEVKQELEPEQDLEGEETEEEEVESASDTDTDTDQDD